MSTTSSHPKPPIFVRNSASLQPPSISFVVAEPQQTRFLSTAASNLSILRRAMPTVPESSQADPTSMSTPESREPSPPIEESPLKVADVPSQPVPGQTLVITPNHASPTPRVDQSESITNPPDTPVAVSQQTAHSLPNKRPWFNLFYVSPEKEVSATDVKIEVNSVSQREDGIHTPSGSTPHLSSLEAIRPTGSTTADGNSSLPAEPPKVSQLPRPSSNRPDGSSVCEGRPASQPSPGPLPSGAPQTRASTSPPIAPNNVAASVFTLSLPMLTKPKPQPEIAVAPPPEDLSLGPSNYPPAATPDSREAPKTASPDVTETDCSTSKVDVSECGDKSLGQSTAATEVHTSSWWAYMRWNASASATKVDSSLQDDASSQSVNASIPLTAPERLHISDPNENSQPLVSPDLHVPAQPESETEAPVDLDSDVGTTKHSPPDNIRSPSVPDASATTVSLGPTWYAPWSWYQPSSSDATTTVPPDNSGSQQAPSPQQSLMGSKTEEKRPVGDHGGHSTPDQVLPAEQDLSATGPVHYSNPIQSVISANPTGWMTFFAAKAIAMKSITEKEDGKMEVMEIDYEMAAPESNSSTATQPPSIPAANGVQHPTTEASSPSFPTLRKTSDKRTPIPQAVAKSGTVTHDALKRQPSPSPSKQSGVKTPTLPPPLNLVLPTWHDTFHTLPRSAVPREPPSVLSKTLQYVSGVLFSRDEAPSGKGKGKGKQTINSPYEKALPRTWEVLGKGDTVDVLRGCRKVVVIGVHGWFPGTVLRTLAGEPTGTSAKLVSGIVDALDLFQGEHQVKLEKVTKIPLEGEGTINRRVERLYQNLIGNKEWMDDLHDADAIFVATHSQGSVVSTHLLDRLITDRHIRTTFDADASTPATGVASGSVPSVRPPQRICCVALCGIHLGPLRYLSTSSLVQPYIQYFESTAARELFEFQNSESPLSRDYVRALQNVLNNGIKMVYIASLNDQVVGLYSGLFTSVSHPLILRALYIDGDAYHPSDFLSHLLVLLLRIRNAGLSDGGLLTHLSEVTAGSLNGIGHSTPYEERATYSLAINYLFLTERDSGAQVELTEEPFNALAERNDYEIPWALRDLIADDRVVSLFSDEIVALRDTFRDWHPKTSILRDVKRKLQPIQRLSSASMASHPSRL